MFRSRAVLVQPENGEGTSGSVGSSPPLRGGFSRHGGLSSNDFLPSGCNAGEGPPALLIIGSISPPGYPSGWLPPCRAVRDLNMALGAFAFARLSAAHEKQRNEDHLVDRRLSAAWGLFGFFPLLAHRSTSDSHHCYWSCIGRMFFVPELVPSATLRDCQGALLPGGSVLTWWCGRIAAAKH